MSTRFPWGRVSVEEACAEMIRRHRVDKIDNLRKITSDNAPDCIVCENQPEPGEWCYYPAATPNSQTNTTIAHKDCAIQCVDKDKKKAAGQQIDKTVVPITQPPAKTVTLAKPGASAKPSTSVAPEWYAGWHIGVRYGFGELVEQNVVLSSSWIAGFEEGKQFASAHRDALA